MGTYLRVFDSHEDYESYENSIQFKRPNVCVCLTENMEAHYNPTRNKIYGTQYLTFELITEGTITVQATNSAVAGKNISYSVDEGNSWISLTTSTGAQTIGSSYQAGQKLLVKGLNNTYATSSYYTKFGGTAQHKVYGNIMSLIYGDDFKGKTLFPSGSTATFYGLFYGSTNLVDVSNLILPAITLTLNCYQSMFQGCTSLTQAPELPATTLAEGCYRYMFWGCSSLTQAPKLPGTTLAQYCYQRMFYGCTSLTQAPELPATTLTSGCYENMFYNCTNLNYIKAMFTTTPSTSYNNKWVYGVATTGTFIKNSAATWNETGINGIPRSWTVQTASS